MDSVRRLLATAWGKFVGAVMVLAAIATIVPVFLTPMRVGFSDGPRLVWTGSAVLLAMKSEGPDDMDHVTYRATIKPKGKEEAQFQHELLRVGSGEFHSNRLTSTVLNDETIPDADAEVCLTFDGRLPLQRAYRIYRAAFSSTELIGRRTTDNMPLVSSGEGFFGGC